MAQPDVEEVVRGYIKLRDKKTEIKRQHGEQLAPINEKMDLLENWLLRDLQTRKVQSQKTAEGTAYQQKAVSATVKDRDAFIAYVKANDAFDLIENRVSKSVVMDHLENTGEIIPGVNIEQTFVVRVRR